MAKDPVCGMEVDEETAEHRIEHRGKTYYFCAPSMQTSTQSNPEKYVE